MIDHGDNMLGLLRQIEADLAEIKLDTRETNASMGRIETMLDSMIEMSAATILMADCQNVKLERTLHHLEGD